MKIRSLTLVTSIICLLLQGVGKSSVPTLINAQGKLAAGDGSALSDSTYSITFTIYDAESGGNVIWTESNPAVAITEGQFNVLLGSFSPISNSVFSGDERYLGIKVGTDPEMTPRSRLVSVGYAQRVGTIDGATGGAIAGDMSLNGNFTGNGNASIKNFLSVDPIEPGSTPIIDLSAGYGNRTGVLFRGNGSGGNSSLALRLNQSPSSTLTITESGFNPEANLVTGWNDLFVFQRDNFTIQASGTGSTPILDFGAGSGNRTGILFRGNGSGGNRSMALRHDQGTTSHLVIGESGAIPALNLVDDWTDLFEFQSDGDAWCRGSLSACVLEIRGGCDISEPFETTGEVEIVSGSVVIIDNLNPGKLKLSSTPYDTRVAGIVSGAGGVRPGLTLKQEGKLEQGQNIALSGRVFVKATASNGPIKPGDRLTSSSIPGCAMKVTDSGRADGAVIGKAMTGLDSGEGLVLVLVNLQ